MSTFVNTKELSKVLSSYLLECKKVRRLSYKEISERLHQHDIYQTPQNLSTKFNSGVIGGQLLIAVLIVMDEELVDLIELKNLWHSIKTK